MRHPLTLRRASVGLAFTVEVLPHPVDSGSGLLAMPTPCAGLSWLRNRLGLDLLTALATGTCELTHGALSAWPSRQTSSHLRDLLTGTGILPDRDPHLAAFESWLHHRLDSLTGHPHLGVLRRYARFTLLVRRADTGDEPGS